MDYQEQANYYRRQARRDRRRTKKYAEDAAESYAWAAKWKAHAAWLTNRPELWYEGSTPAHWETMERASRRLADAQLRHVFSLTRHYKHYFQLARDYEGMASESRTA